MIGKTNIGGGSQQLNYSVVGGTEQPAGRENLIWVNTSTNITSHIFSVATPTYPSEGMVWFKTSGSSNVAFQATKKNPIMVYPNNCQQYISGAWVGKTAKTYMNDVWVNWELILFSLNDYHVDITGDYQVVAVGRSGTTAWAPTKSMTEDGKMTIALSAPANITYCGSVLTNNQIDLTSFNNISIKAEYVTNNYDNYRNGYLYITADPSNYTNNAGSILITKKTETNLDISNKQGKYFIGINLKDPHDGQTGNTQFKMAISEIKLS